MGGIQGDFWENTCNTDNKTVKTLLLSLAQRRTQRHKGAEQRKG